MAKYRYLKTRDVLESFFCDPRAITVTGVRDFAKEKGIILFARDRAGIPSLLSSIFLGIDSLRRLARYVNTESLAVSGFLILERSRGTMLLLQQSLYQVLDHWRGKELTRDGITLRNLSLESNGVMLGQISYHRAALGVDVTEIDRVEESVDFQIIPESGDQGQWNAVVVQRKTRDFNVVLEAVKRILGQDNLSRWNTRLVSIDEVPDSERRYELLVEWIQTISEEYEILGSLEVSGKRDFEIMPRDEFDAAKDTRIASLLDLYPVEEVLKNIRQEGAYTRGLRLVLRDKNSLLEIWLKGKRNRAEISVLQEREFTRNSAVRNAADIQSLQVVYLEDQRRIEVAGDLWRSFCEAFQKQQEIRG